MASAAKLARRRINPSRVGLTFRNCEWIDDLWLHDSARTNQAYWNSATDNRTVFNDANTLQVTLELSLADSSCLASVTAEVLCFTALADTVTNDRLQVAVKFVKLCSFDSLIFFQCAHCYRFYYCRF